MKTDLISAMYESFLANPMEYAINKTVEFEKLLKNENFKADYFLRSGLNLNNEAEVIITCNPKCLKKFRKLADINVISYKKYVELLEFFLIRNPKTFKAKHHADFINRIRSVDKDSFIRIVGKIIEIDPKILQKLDNVSIHTLPNELIVKAFNKVPMFYMKNKVKNVTNQLGENVIREAILKNPQLARYCDSNTGEVTLEMVVKKKKILRYYDAEKLLKTLSSSEIKEHYDLFKKITFKKAFLTVSHKEFLSSFEPSVDNSNFIRNHFPYLNRVDLSEFLISINKLWSNFFPESISDLKQEELWLDHLRDINNLADIDKYGLKENKQLYEKAIKFVLEQHHPDDLIKNDYPTVYQVDNTSYTLQNLAKEYIGIDVEYKGNNKRTILTFNPQIPIFNEIHTVSNHNVCFVIDHLTERAWYIKFDYKKFNSYLHITNGKLKFVTPSHQRSALFSEFPHQIKIHDNITFNDCLAALKNKNGYIGLDNIIYLEKTGRLKLSVEEWGEVFKICYKNYVSVISLFKSSLSDNLLKAFYVHHNYLVTKDICGIIEILLENGINDFPEIDFSMEYRNNHFDYTGWVIRNLGKHEMFSKLFVDYIRDRKSIHKNLLYKHWDLYKEALGESIYEYTKPHENLYSSIL